MNQASDQDRKLETSTALRLAGEGIVMVPGCLTSESEERETWTAESLRAALLRSAKVDLHRKAFIGKHFNGKWPEETSAVLRFKVFYIARSRKRSDV